MREKMKMRKKEMKRNRENEHVIEHSENDETVPNETRNKRL